jgi:hypothetical protein
MGHDHAFATDFAIEAAKGTPPVVVAAGSVIGLLELNVAVAILTGLYVLLQGAYLIWKWRREANRG